MLYIKTIFSLIFAVLTASFLGYYSNGFNKANASIASINKNDADKQEKLKIILSSGSLPGYFSKSGSNNLVEYHEGLKMRIPSVPQRFYKPFHKNKIKYKLATINRKYGNYIKQASLLTNVPANLITSFIFIESGGKSGSVDKKSGATGLMQLTEGSCSDILWLENKLNRLTSREKKILRKTIGSRLDCILSMKHMGQKRRCNGNAGYNVFTEDLRNPEFNILCGTIYLRILIRNHTEKGVVRLDKIVAKYNIGFFTKIKGNTPEEVMMHTNRETRSYIRKLAGRNGLLDIISI